MRFLSSDWWSIRGSEFRQRPYFVEYTRSHPNSEVKRRKARSVLGWGTAREALRVLLAFCDYSSLKAFAKFIHDEKNERLRGRITTIRTLSQNGYGDDNQFRDSHIRIFRRAFAPVALPQRWQSKFGLLWNNQHRSHVMTHQSFAFY